MQLDYETCDVFTTTRFGGNPLAVVHGAEALDAAAMQAIAREFNLSETVFVLPATTPGSDARLRIFTPGTELPFAGHPNVGTAVLLARRLGRGDKLVLDQAAGPVLARLMAEDGQVSGAAITAPQPFSAGGTIPVEAAAACVGLPAKAIREEVALGGCGLHFAFAEVTDEIALAAAAPDIAAFHAHLPRRVAAGLYLFTRLAPGRLRARMFGPLLGVVEDPATGSAGCGLGGLLLHRLSDAALAVEVEQGVEMGRPSLLHLAARREGGSIRVEVGGGVIAVARGTIEV